MRNAALLLFTVSSACLAQAPHIPVAGGSINPATGQFYPQIGPHGLSLDTRTGTVLTVPEAQSPTYLIPSGDDGAIEPRTGTRYQRVGGGVVNTNTGEFHPER